MPNTLGKIIADFSTTLSLKVAIGDTSATLSSATDDDGVALPTGTYFLTVDGNSASKEYIMCTLTSTALTSIQNISRQGTTTSGFIRTHRKGATVSITDFATLKKMLDLLDGTTAIEGAVFTDITFSGTTTGGLKVKSLTTAQRNAITPANGQIVYDSTLGENYQYIAGAWSAVSSGSTQPNASATVAGKVEIATTAQSIAGTDTGETGALNSVLPSDIAKNIQSGTFVYGADAGGDDTYVVALTPTLAAYTTGQVLYAKMTTANTGACTIDFGPGAKSVKLINGDDPATGDIASGKVSVFIYDGTNLILQNPAVIVTDVQTFTASGTWTKPTGAKVVEIVCIGAGGGGGAGDDASGPATCGGAGGGGGAVYRAIYKASELGATETITVGTGGTGGTGGGSPTAGGNGGLSSFGTWVVAGAGGGGAQGSTGGISQAGSGGALTSAALATAGDPAATNTSPISGNAIGGQGSSSNTSGGVGRCSEYGGASAGGCANTSAGSAGGSSVFAGPGGGSGGGGGGGGGGAGAAGGTCGSYATGGGGAGGAIGGNAGTAGSANSTLQKGYCGSAGGGGGGINGNGNGGAGGAGGAPGAGGGGGGSGGNTGGNLAGAGGAGGRGEVRVYTYL